jgi:AcrR family transcriptional regulator
MTDQPPRVLRRDAAANQARIVEAARHVFAEQGVDVALSEVAKEAGVGLATLTRRFTRVRLVEAVLVDRTDEHLRLLEEALALPAADSVDHYLRSLSTRQLSDRSVCHALTLSLPDSTRVAEHRGAIRVAQLELIRRAQEAGTLRPGIVPEDFVYVLEAVDGVIRGGAPEAWRRVLALLLDGLRAAGAAGPLPPTPSAGEPHGELRPPPRGRRTTSITAAGSPASRTDRA